MRHFLIRLHEAVLKVLTALRSPQRAVLEVTLEFQRLRYHWWQSGICESGILSVDVGKLVYCDQSIHRFRRLPATLTPSSERVNRVCTRPPTNCHLATSNHCPNSGHDVATPPSVERPTTWDEAMSVHPFYLKCLFWGLPVLGAHSHLLETRVGVSVFESSSPAQRGGRRRVGGPGWPRPRGGSQTPLPTPPKSESAAGRRWFALGEEAPSGERLDSSPSQRPLRRDRRKWPPSDRNGDRLRIGTVTGFRRNRWRERVHEDFPEQPSVRGRA